MKKAVFATKVGRTISDDEQQRIEQLAKSKGAKMIGVVEYPELMPLVVPDIMVEKVQACNADLIITDDPSFVISEFVHDTSLYTQFKKENIEVFDLDTGLSIKETVNQMSKDIENQSLNNKQSLKDMLKEVIEQQQNNIMLITKDAENIDMKDYIKEYALDDSISSICTVNIEGFEDFMSDPIKDIVKQHDIKKIIICDEYDSIKMSELMEQFAMTGIEVSYSTKEQTMSQSQSSFMMN